MDRSITIIRKLPANNAYVEVSPIVATDKVWRIDEFGALDINTGDNISSVYVLQYGNDTSGWQLIRAISLTGNTQAFNINKEFTGDGTKQFRVIMQNNCGTEKDLHFWIKLIERS